MTRSSKQLRIPLLPIMALVVASIVFAMLAITQAQAQEVPTVPDVAILVTTTTATVAINTTPGCDIEDVILEYGQDASGPYTNLASGVCSDLIGNEYELTGLTANTEYYVRVSATLEGSVISTDVVTPFTTAPIAQADVVSITVSAITTTTATLTISSDNNNGGPWVAYRYKPTSGGSAAWVGGTLAYSSSLTVNLTGLTASTPYEVQAFNHNTANTDRFLPGGDGWTTWPAQIRHASFTTASSNTITSVTARSVGPAVAQIIANLTGINSTTAINFRYRVATPPGAWTTAAENAVANDTTAIHKITSGLVVGTEYDIEASISSTFVTSVSTTHTHLGTTILLWDVVVDKIWEVADISDVPGSDAELGDAMTVMNDVRALTELNGWMYAVDQDRTFWRTRTPKDPSTYTQMGTFPSSAGSVHSLFALSGSLYAVGGSYLFQIPNLLDASAAITVQAFSSSLTVVRGSNSIDGKVYIWDHQGNELWRLSGISTPATATEITLTGLQTNHDVRGMTDFNGRFMLHEEDTKSLDEMVGFAGTSAEVVSLGIYDSSVAGVNALASWSNNPAPIVASVSIDSILDTSVTANITATDATSAGVDFRFRYRTGSSGAWTDATSVNSTTTTAAISVTGLAASQAYNYQASLNSAFPADDRTEGTFTTVAATTQLGKVSGVVLTAPVDNGLTVTWTAVTTATSYRVRWATTSGGQSSTNEAVVNSGVTYDITGLATNDEYFVQVRAETTAVGYTSGLYSDEVSKLTSIPAPTNVTTSATATTITVSWDAVTGATAYEVWYNVSGGTRFDITGSPLPTTYTITGLTTGTTYMVWTAAKIGSAEGRFSTRIDVTPAAPITAQAPTDVTLVAGFETITASWTAPTDTGNAAITGYVLEYKTKGADTWETPIDLGNVIEHIIPSLTAGTTYAVRVATKNSAGTGPWSSPIVSAKAEGPPDKPQSPNGRISISADSSTLSQMEIYWSEPNDNGGGITAYDLQYRIVGNSTWTTVNQRGTIYNATGLTLHKKYEMQVRATNSHGTSEYSSPRIVQFSPRWAYMVQGSAGSGLSRWSGDAAVSLNGIFSDGATDASDLATLGNRLFAIRSGIVKKLYEIDPSTNLATEICTYTLGGSAYGLAGLDGDLYLYNEGSIYTLDEASCATSLVGATGRADLHGMASLDGRLYSSTGAAGALYMFLINTGDATLTNFVGFSAFGVTHAIAANGYRLYLPTHTNAGGLKYVSLRDLKVHLEGQRNFGNTAIVDVNGIAILTMIPPDAPTLDSVNPSVGSLALVWSAPADTGTGSVTGYSIQYKLGTSSTWVDWTFSGTSTSTSITGLQNGVSYDVQIAAKNIIGLGAYAGSTVSTGSTVPDAPTSLTLTPSGSQIEANWTAPGNNGGSAITGYSVQYKTGVSATWIDWTHTATSTTATITGLTNGTEYDVRVASKNLIGTGTYTSESVIPNISLAVPANITATPDTDNIVVNWGDVTDATGYVIQWSTSSTFAGSPNEHIDTPPAASTYTIAGLAEATLYFVRVKATASGASDSLWAKTSTTTTVSPLEQVTGLSVVGSSASTLDVNWADVPNATAYKVQWRVDTTGTFSLTRQLDPHPTSSESVIPGLLPGTTYNVRVRAVRGSNLEGPWSGIEDGTTYITPPGKVANVRLSTTSSSKIVVTWDAATNADAYKIQWRIASGSYDTTNQQVPSVGDLTDTIINLTSNTLYYIQVTATRTGANDGTPSDTQSRRTLLTAPDQVTNIIVGAVVYNSANLTMGRFQQRQQLCCAMAC